MSWKAEYVILIMVSTLVDYFAALQIDKTENIRKRKIFLGLSLFSNLGLLFAFKYFNFFSNSIREFLNIFSIQFNQPVLNVLLPIGISFYTFQTLGYTIDVYRKKIKPEKHLGIFAVYVSFFPQLVAGPIERAENLLPQFFRKYDFDYKRVTNGLKLMLWGFFKKVVIADNLTIIVNSIYSNPSDYTGLPLILATFFFAFQIYCDFSGYTDIAIGSAQVMGYRLMDNFRRPYFSQTISEFWKRWHISLSSWFKDYFYIPLGGSRVKLPRWFFNLFIVFLISGLWHGANWTFVIWGALHGFYLIFGIITKNIRDSISQAIGLRRFPKFHKIIKISITFILVNIGWIFFRANSLSDAIYIITHLFEGITFNIFALQLVGITTFKLMFGFAIIMFLEFIHLIQEHVRMRQFLSNQPIIIRWSVYITLIILILIFGAFNNTPFIYFQF